MKFFSDLLPSRSPLSEQISALAFAGFAAIALGCAVHLTQTGWVADEAAALTAAVEDITPEPLNAQSIPIQPSASVQQLAQAAAGLAQKSEWVARDVTFGRRDTLANLLAEADLSEGEAKAVTAALSKVYSPRKLRQGQEVTLNFIRRGEVETFDGLTMQPEDTVEVKVVRQANGGFKAEKIVTPLERQRYAVAGSIQGSLSNSAAREGVPRSVTAAMMRIFAHDVDFQRDLRAGDKFRVLYDQATNKAGKPVGNATIIYAALEIGGKTKAMYRVVYPDGRAEYFNEKGEGIQRALLRTPIDGARVTSSFGMRRHPILGYSKMHQGVDFGAPTGTPIFAAGDGVIVDIGFKNGYGRYIKIRHQGGLSTAYAHMSRFARGMSRGTRVDQGDVIAYVGSSGRSTGPHLHYEVHVNGRHANPNSVSASAGQKLDGKLLAQFKKGKPAIESEFNKLLLARHEQKQKEIELAANTVKADPAKR